mmetsp:Transcript_23485/g.79329  ORF Transcript_23485/g.79329 Transcript_23485/m.79329 type:complete len:244 (+) Transcript_23485:504-1235(+)
MSRASTPGGAPEAAFCTRGAPCSSPWRHAAASGDSPSGVGSSGSTWALSKSSTQWRAPAAAAAWSGRWPSSAAASAVAPAARSNSTQCAAPAAAAACSGVVPPPAGKEGWAPCAKSSWVLITSPVRQAATRGVRPPSCTESAKTDAPQSRRARSLGTLRSRTAFKSAAGSAASAAPGFCCATSKTRLCLAVTAASWPTAMMMSLAPAMSALWIKFTTASLLLHPRFTQLHLKTARARTSKGPR